MTGSTRSVIRRSASNIKLTTSDPYDPSDPDTSQAFAAGAGNYQITYNHPFQRASTTGWTVSVSTVSGPAYTTSTSGLVVVNPDTLTGGIHTHQLLVVLPGETYDPGNTAAFGRLGTPDFSTVTAHPNPVQAGDNFPVTVIGTDRFYNRIFDNQNPLVLVGADPTLFAAYNPSANFQIASGSNTITASINRSTTTATFVVNQQAPINTYTYSAATSTLFNVGQASATHAQLLIQGESALPGSPTGKTGTPAAMTAGVNYLATVNVTDAGYNITPSASARVKLVVNDPFSPTNNVQQDLLSGSTVYNLKFYTANPVGWLVNVSTTSGLGLSTDQSPLLPVTPNTATHVMVTVPGTDARARQRRRRRLERFGQRPGGGNNLARHRDDHG